MAMKWFRLSALRAIRLPWAASKARPRVEPLESRQLLATSILFNPTGAAGATPIAIGGFDESPGNALAVASLPLTVGKTFQLDYEAVLGGLIGTNGGTVTPPGLNSTYQITVVASFTEMVTGNDGVSASFTLAPTQSANSFFEVYYNPATVADNLAGTGFNVGTLILSGKPLADQTSSGNFALAFGANNQPIIQPFDQFNNVNYPGQLSVTGTGSSLINVQVTSIDPAFFQTPVVQLGFNTNTTTPFNTTDPAALFVGVAGTAAAAVVANPGAVNGASGPDFQFQADANNSFTPAAPAIAIVKATNGVVAPTAPGPIVGVGSVVTWTYDVTNPGNEPIKGLTVTDDAGTPGLAGDDFHPTYVSGDANGNGLLDPGEDWRFTATGTAKSGQYQNTVATAGVGSVSGLPVAASSISHYFAAAPAIAIVKETNGQYAPTAPGPIVGVGSAVTWTYAVTNIGNEPLRGVNVLDDAGTPGVPANDFHPTFVGGDANGNGLLDVGEVWQYTATGIAKSGQYENLTGTSGVGSISGETVTAGSISHYFAAAPAIAIVKATNGVVAPTAPGPIVGVGSAVTWTYDVTNPGNEPIKGLTVTDDAGTPGLAGDDFHPTYVSGDANGNGLLDPGEDWRFTATGTAKSGQYQNTVATAGVGSVSGLPVAASSISHYFAAAPAIAIVKATDGVIAPTAPGPIVGVGSKVTWTYAVTNTGDEPIAGLTVLDDAGTPGLAGDDFHPTYVSGDANGNGLLDPGEIWGFTATGTATSGQYQNTVTTGGVGSVSGLPVAASSISHYFAAAPGIAIVKETNGVTAPNPPGPGVLVGSTVTWTYAVTNTGDEPLRGVSVLDDAGTAGLAGDDFHPTYVGGDANGNGLLDVGEVWRYTATGAAIGGQYQNTATTAGVGTISGEGVTGSAVSHYFAAAPVIPAPAITITKTTDGLSAPTAPGPTLTVYSPVTWTYTVTNTGNVSFTNINVLDDAGTFGVPGDDFHPTFVGGDANGNGLLDPGEAWQYTATGTVQSGQYTNTAAVAAADAGGAVVSGVAQSNYNGACPMVIGVQRLGVHLQPTQVVLSVDGTLPPSIAQNTANYQLTSIGKDGRFDVPDPVVSAVYNATANTITLTAAHRLNVHHLSEITVAPFCPDGSAFTGVLNRKYSLGATTIIGKRGHHFVFPATDVPTVLNPSILPSRLVPSNRAATNRLSLEPSSGAFASPGSVAIKAVVPSAKLAHHKALKRA